MHIPDGFLDTRTWATMTVVSGGALAIAVRRTKTASSEQRIPLMGVMSAFIFAAQMLNFPVAAGTSGHFVGGVLAALILGPATGLLMMTAVLVVQCFVFQDGGVTALGANIANMGIIGSSLSYFVYSFLRHGLRLLAGERTAALSAAVVAGWLSTVASAAACAAELAVSGTVPLRAALPAMLGVHAVIGIGEGVITALVVSFLMKVRPDLLQVEKV